MKTRASRRRLRLPRGVLKIKVGYNPNSSSIGTVIYSFPIAFTVLSAILGVVAACIARGGRDT